MNVLNARNPHRALPYALELLRLGGDERPSRNGPVLQAGAPVTTVYEKPLERVMYHAARDANPCFHLFESCWMLAGRNDVASLTRIVARMADFSDDGTTFHGAYGYRWRVGDPLTQGQGMDQLAWIAAKLAANPQDRRQVLQMWSSRTDLAREQQVPNSRDVPCNLMATFQVNAEGSLDLVVFNRSNDIIWGCYGANAVHFSYLLEYVARRAKLPVGRYWQISVNWHGYRSTFDPLWEAMQDQSEDLLQEPCPYERGLVAPYPLMQEDTNPDLWDADNVRLCRSLGRAPSESRWHDPFFPDVVVPMLRAHDAFKDISPSDERYEVALREADKVRATDWRMAMQEWLTRRYGKFKRDRDDGPVEVAHA